MTENFPQVNVRQKATDRGGIENIKQHRNKTHKQIYT